MKIARSGILAIAILSLATSIARADRALLVGINRYPGYADMDLNAPLNDIAVMRAALQKRGFAVTTLFDARATRSGVLQALATLQKQMRASERLVFYFSGHGARDTRDNTHLLLHDIVVDERSGRSVANPSRSLPIATLHRAVCAIEARSRTIILDAQWFPFRELNVPKPSTPQPRFQVIKTTATSSQKNHKACYLIGNRLHEETADDVFDGTTHGVFTYFLARHLNQTKSRTWNDLFTRVSADVVGYTAGAQHPRLSAPYMQSIVFGGLDTRATIVARADKTNRPQVGSSMPSAPIVGMPQPVESMPPGVLIQPRGVKVEPKPQVPTDTPKAETPKVSGTWGEWSGFNAQRERFSIRMRPDKIDVPIGQEVTFDVSMGAPGYLIVLERGTSGKVNLLFPPEAKIEQARVEATTPERPLKLPAGDFALAPDAPGLERLRAFWFANEDAAKTLLQHFNESPSLLSASALSRPAQVPMTGDTVLTSDLLFEVVAPPQ